MIFWRRQKEKISNLAEKKFALAGGGTFVCPILTGGGHSTGNYYQGSKVLTYLGLECGWVCERTPDERETEKEFSLMSIIPKEW